MDVRVDQRMALEQPRHRNERAGVGGPVVELGGERDRPLLAQTLVQGLGALLRSGGVSSAGWLSEWG